MKMKLASLALTGVVAATLAAAPLSQAHADWHGHGGWHGGGWHHDDHSGLFFGLGVGALTTAALLDRPYYYGPPCYYGPYGCYPYPRRVYYAPPPPYYYYPPPPGWY